MDDEGGPRHEKAVSVRVSWRQQPSEYMRDVGKDDCAEVEVQVSVQPELKLPKSGAKGKEWTKTEDVHPFWFIKRTDKDESEANTTLISQDVTHVMACSLQALARGQAKVGHATNTFSVSLPILVNTLPIKAGEEVILKWKTKPEKIIRRPAVSAFTQLVKTDKRQRISKETKNKK